MRSPIIGLRDHRRAQILHGFGVICRLIQGVLIFFEDLGGSTGTSSTWSLGLQFPLVFWRHHGPRELILQYTFYWVQCSVIRNGFWHLHETWPKGGAETETQARRHAVPASGTPKLIERQVPNEYCIVVLLLHFSVFSCARATSLYEYPDYTRLCKNDVFREFDLKLSMSG
jgi:hypothetical protein